MRKRRTIKAALTAATIAVAVALPVATANAANAATASPQLHTVVEEGWYTVYTDCTYEGSTLMLQAGSDGYDCRPTYFCQPGWCVVDGWDLWSYWD